MVKARFEKDSNGTHRVFVQRAKFKHWFELGRHSPTDISFQRVLHEKGISGIDWVPDIIDHNSLFQK